MIIIEFKYIPPFCLFIWLNKEINLSRMDFTSILVITEVISEFYWKNFFLKEITFEPGPVRAELKLNRAGRA